MPPPTALRTRGARSNGSSRRRAAASGRESARPLRHGLALERLRGALAVAFEGAPPAGLLVPVERNAAQQHALARQPPAEGRLSGEARVDACAHVDHRLRCTPHARHERVERDHRQRLPHVAPGLLLGGPLQECDGVRGVARDGVQLGERFVRLAILPVVDLAALQEPILAAAGLHPGGVLVEAHVARQAAPDERRPADV
eukprot:2278382-Prymnesium_polylepis.1